MTPRFRILCAALVAASAASVHAATPSSGSVSASQPETSWTGATKLATASATCKGPADPACDNYTLTISDPGYPFRVTILLDSTAIGDWDTQLYDAQGNVVDSSGNGPGSPETMEVSIPGTYVVAAAPYAPNPAESYSAKATLVAVSENPPPPPSTESAIRFLTYAPPGLGEPDPDYATYAPTRGARGLGASAGEPTLGIPHANNVRLQQTQPAISNVMYLAGLETLRLEVDSTTSPAIGKWVDASCPDHVTSLDPILHVDPVTGRTISTQLNAKRSLICLSNDEGGSWLSSPQGAGINAGVDHQTLGAGAFPTGDTLRQPDPLNPAVNYANATYYASQDIALAQAAQSRDGGFTWGVSFPMYNLTQCGGLHGHLQVGADGTVYVPNGNCPLGQSGMARSLDGGVNWTVHGVPGSVSDDDPGLGVGRGDVVPGGRVFFGTCQNGKPTIATSDDRGETFTALQDVSGGHDIQACVFPTMVAGDDDRAAFAFLGSSTGGGSAYGSNPAAYDGVWFAYVAVTYDGGRSWVTSEATGGDPVQRGPICLQGTGCAGYRNLLDFNDIQLDEKGRIYFAYSDGCVGNCVTAGPNSLTDYTRIARQQDGTKGLYAQFDAELAPTAVSAPKTPYSEALRTAPGQVELKWVEPFDGNSAITRYEISRRIKDDPTLVKLADVGATARGYTDATTVAGVDYCYQVHAVNAVGRSTAPYESCAAAPLDLGNVCVAPGLQLGDDRSGELVDSTSVGIRRLFAGEPFLADPADCSAAPPSKVEFNINVGSPLLAGNALILVWNRQTGTVASRIAGAQPDDRNMVSVRMVGNSPQCRFGHVTGSSLLAPLPTHGYDISAPFPAADCVVRNDGTVTVRVDTSVIDDGTVGPGYSFGGLDVRAFPAQPVATATAPQPVLQTSSADFLVATAFTLAGNAACRADFDPEAVDDTISSDFKSPTTFDALANDRANDCDTISIASVTNGAFGRTSIASDGRIVYTPTKHGKCSDAFSYKLRDTNGNTDTAVVIVRGTHARCSN